MMRRRDRDKCSHDVFLDVELWILRGRPVQRGMEAIAMEPKHAQPL